MKKETEKTYDRIHSKSQLNTYTLRNHSGSYVRLTNFGARIMSIVVPDNNGHMDNVVLGFDEADDYLNDNCYMGATIGQVANRISNAEFNLNQETYKLDANDGINSNHGGFFGLDKRIFNTIANNNSVVFTTDTSDGDGGFPGNVHIEVTYTFNDDNVLRIDYFATTTKTTILNLTNHAYFNLSACQRTAIDSHLQIGSSQIAASSPNYIPTGEFTPVKNSRYDFSTLTKINDKNYNDYYILDSCSKNEIAATMMDHQSGRILDLYTSYPGLFFYSADFLKSNTVGSHGREYAPLDGICLEAQLYPNAINQTNFPSIVLNPGDQYKHYIALHFHSMQ